MTELGAETKKCPNCAEDVKSEANGCRFCGFDFKTGRMPNATTPGKGAPAGCSASAITAMCVIVVIILLIAMIGGSGNKIEDQSNSQPLNAGSDDSAAAAKSNGDHPLPTGVRRPSLEEFAKVLGRDCPTPTETEYKGEGQGSYHFVVECAGGDQLVLIGSDGSTSYLSCAQTELLGENLCTKEW